MGQSPATPAIDCRQAKPKAPTAEEPPFVRGTVNAPLKRSGLPFRFRRKRGVRDERLKGGDSDLRRTTESTDRRSMRAATPRRFEKTWPPIREQYRKRPSLGDDSSTDRFSPHRASGSAPRGHRGWRACIGVGARNDGGDRGVPEDELEEELRPGAAPNSAATSARTVPLANANCGKRQVDGTARTRRAGGQERFSDRARRATSSPGRNPESRRETSPSVVAAHWLVVMRCSGKAVLPSRSRPAVAASVTLQAAAVERSVPAAQ